MKKTTKSVKAKKVTVKRVASVPTTARKMLDLIDRFFVKSALKLYSNNEGAKLWKVLSALRGPDNYESLQKESTTVPIRRAAFPKFAENGAVGVAASFGFANQKYKAPVADSNSPGYSAHFHSHVDSAARVLGLVKSSID